MKPINNKILLLLMALAFTAGCKKDYLDRQLGTLLEEEQVFTSYNNTERFLTGIYTHLPAGFDRIDGAMLESATDDAEHTAEVSAIQRFNNGNWSAFSNPEDQWSNFYTGIRRANVFIANVNRVNLDIERLNPSTQIEYQNKLNDLERWKHEARFLRAYFYFELVKRYGGVPLITSVLAMEDNLTEIPRNSLEECLSFIAAECDLSAAGLNTVPGRIVADPYAVASGRVTRGAAMALKSRTLLYAASPLYLDPNDISNAKPSNPIKWQAAATAAKAVIDLVLTGSPSKYALVASYASLHNSINNTELILARRSAASNTFERANFPVGYEGLSGTTPSQNLVDSYERKDGTAFNWNNPAHATNPYANRDNRLAQTILLNGTTWKGRAVQSFTGGLDGKGKDRATKTGYYLKKHVAEGVNLVTNTAQVHAWPLFRLAEIYLNYAEALNEYNPAHTDIRTYVNLVRTRSGQPNLPTTLSQEQMREKIKNERRIELAFEEHRFWDVRRWKDGTTYFNTPLRGVQITQTGTTSFNYEPVVVESRLFEPKMYWYPIPQNELMKSNGWIQNRGW